VTGSATGVGTALTMVDIAIGGTIACWLWIERARRRQTDVIVHRKDARAGTELYR
jgi:hypothetical protein